MYKRQILRSIVALARELGMPTVVEGVETSQQVHDLSKIGCDIFQGFYFSRPISVADFETRFRAGEIQPLRRKSGAAGNVEEEAEGTEG